MQVVRVAAAAACCALAGCMTYGGYPEGYDKPVITQTKSQKTLNFAIEGSAMFAGPGAIRNVLAAEAPYAAVSPAEKPPASGDYLSVKITQVPPSVTAVTFGYISYATATIIPFWSTQDGALLQFTLYRDGTQNWSREYIIRRKTFVWLPMILIAWINFSTTSEEEAFAASTRDFLATLGGTPPAPLKD